MDKCKVLEELGQLFERGTASGLDWYSASAPGDETIAALARTVKIEKTERMLAKYLRNNPNDLCRLVAVTRDRRETDERYVHG